MQFYFEMIVTVTVVSPLKSRDQIEKKNVRMSLNELRQSGRKTWTKINMIFVIKTQRTVLANSKF